MIVGFVVGSCGSVLAQTPDRIPTGPERFSLTAGALLPAFNTDARIDDVFYPAGASLSAKFRLRLMPITYSYSLIQTDRQELAGTLGLNWQALQFDAQGTAFAGAQGASAELDGRADLPLPALGLRWNYRMSPRWTTGLSAGAFALKVADGVNHADGTLLTGRAYAEYGFTRNVGMGLAVEAFRLDADVKDSEWNGKLNYRYWGPQIYLKARF